MHGWCGYLGCPYMPLLKILLKSLVLLCEICLVGPKKGFRVQNGEELGRWRPSEWFRDILPSSCQDLLQHGWCLWLRVFWWPTRAYQLSRLPQVLSNSKPLSRSNTASSRTEFTLSSSSFAIGAVRPRGHPRLPTSIPFHHFQGDHVATRTLDSLHFCLKNIAARRTSGNLGPVKIGGLCLIKNFHPTSCNFQV